MQQRSLIGLVLAAFISGSFGCYFTVIRPAWAGVSCTLPFTLTNGTIADATQVMSNYNALVTCLANAAAAGANSDITSLSGLITPIGPTAGGSNVFLATASVQTGGQISITSTTPSGWTNTKGYTVIFTATTTPTQNTAISVNAQTSGSALRQLSAPQGFAAVGAGDLRPLTTYTAVFDGVSYIVNTVNNTAFLHIADQTVSGGANVSTLGLGPISGGTTTIDCGARPLQSFTNNGAFTLAAPVNDGSCVLGDANGGSAGTITFSGFTVGANTGDALDNMSGHNFMITIVRISGVATYTVKALQ
jgi:hypothetical protein